MTQPSARKTTLTRLRRASRRTRALRSSLVLAAALAAGAALTAPAAPAASAAAVPLAHSPASAAVPLAPPPSPGQPDFGQNVYIFTPSMPESEIQATVNSIASQQVSNQFGTQRYALLFEPGSYGTAADPLTFQVGYYTEVAGLGSSPSDVTINGTVDVYNQCFAPAPPATSNCTALDNFWRSLSNLTVNITGQSGCQSGTDFWAVSQAAPMRRVDITGGNVSLFDYCSAGPQFSSGGFIADSAFSGGTIISGSQQQFIVRNSDLDGWTNGVWNQVFSGDQGAPPQSFGVPGGAGPYTTLAASPQTQEEPFLFLDSGGRYNVFVPSLRHDSAGTSWAGGATAGTSIPIRRFFIASPGTPVALTNAALALGENLILTPGVYDLSQTIEVTRPGTVVLGLGFPTLIPSRGIVSMQVASVAGVKLSGMIFDAGPVSSPALLQVGTCRGSASSSRLPGADPACDAGQRGAGRGPADPTLVQDVFFRVGGAEPGQAADSLVVNSSDVILDDIWAWRADHGAGVGWTANVADTGLVVNGNDVTAYGLFVEHYQKFQVIWDGQGGTDIFFQNEMPYDPPDQAAWMSGPATDGYPAVLVTGNVTAFQGYGMGSYSFFDTGVPIYSSEAFEVPDAPGIALHDLLTVFLAGSGGINSVVDGTGAAVNSANGGPSDVTSYP